MLKQEIHSQFSEFLLTGFQKQNKRHQVT